MVSFGDVLYSGDIESTMRPWPSTTHEDSQAQEDTFPAKTDVTGKPPVGDTSVITLIKTDTAGLWESENALITRALGEWDDDEFLVSLRNLSPGCRLGIWIIQDILWELRNVDGGHHGEPPKKWHKWHGTSRWEAAKIGRFQYSNIEIWVWRLNIANLWPKKFVVFLPYSSNKKPGHPMHCRAHAHVLYATSKAHINDTSLAGSAKMIIISIIIGYGYGSKLGTSKLWMVNTKLDFHICGPTSIFHFDPHPYDVQ